MYLLNRIGCFLPKTDVVPSGFYLFLVPVVKEKANAPSRFFRRKSNNTELADLLSLVRKRINPNQQTVSPPLVGLKDTSLEVKTDDTTLNHEGQGWAHITQKSSGTKLPDLFARLLTHLTTGSLANTLLSKADLQQKKSSFRFFELVLIPSDGLPGEEEKLTANLGFALSRVEHAGKGDLSQYLFHSETYTSTTLNVVQSTVMRRMRTSISIDLDALDRTLPSLDNNNFSTDSTTDSPDDRPKEETVSLPQGKRPSPRYSDLFPQLLNERDLLRTPDSTGSLSSLSSLDILHI